MDTYPRFDSLEDADDHVQFNCRGPVLCVVDDQLWKVHGGGFSERATDVEVAKWRATQPQTQGPAGWSERHIRTCNDEH